MIGGRFYQHCNSNCDYKIVETVKGEALIKITISPPKVRACSKMNDSRIVDAEFDDITTPGYNEHPDVSTVVISVPVSILLEDQSACENDSINTALVTCYHPSKIRTQGTEVQLGNFLAAIFDGPLRQLSKLSLSNFSTRIGWEKFLAAIFDGLLR